MPIITLNEYNCESNTPEDEEFLYDSDESEYEETLQYEYYDARGEPYLDTLIRPPSLFETLLYNNVVNEPKYAFDPNLDINKLTCLNEPKKTEDEINLEKKRKQEQLEKERKQREFEIFNKKREEELKKIEHEIFMAKLPRFSTAYLARMKAAEEEKKKIKPKADDKFYTWKKGAKASKTSHTAWGHRRNGGGKGKKITLEDMNDEKKKAELNAFRKARRIESKKKKEAEEEKRIETFKRLEQQKLEFRKNNEVEPVAVTVEPVEETEYQKFKKAELAKAVTMINSKCESITYVVDEQPSKRCKKTEDKSEKWEVVNKIKEKKNTMAKDIEKSFYEKPKTQHVTGKTKLCRSVTSKNPNERCRHGSRCNFAHSPQEITPVYCKFKERCRNISCVNTVWKNKENNRTCYFFHPGETKRDYCIRVGINKARIS